MTPEALHWILGAVASLSLVIVSAVGVLLVKAYRLGQMAEAMEATAKKIDDAKLAIERVGEKLQTIPVHEMRIGQAEHAVARITSDIKDLLRGLSRLEGRSHSKPDWNGRDGEGS